MPKTIEEIVATEFHSPAMMTPADWQFVADMRKARGAGVGFGAMQQYCEWEWNATIEVGGWGPSYFQKRINELESQVATLTRSNDRLRQKIDKLKD